MTDMAFPHHIDGQSAQQDTRTANIFPPFPELTDRRIRGAFGTEFTVWSHASRSIICPVSVVPPVRPRRFGDDRPIFLRLLLDALGRRRTCFLVGAGASFGIVKFTPAEQSARDLLRRQGSLVVDARDSKERRYFVSILFNVPLDVDSTTDDYRRKLEATAGEKEDPVAFVEDLARAWMTPLGPISLWFHDSYTPREQTGPPPAYEVFRLFSPTASILTWNYDGLARQHCPQPVIELHGRASAGLAMAARENSEALSELTMMDVPLAMPSILPYELDPEDLLEEPEFVRAWRLVSNSTAIVIVGYSFGGMADRYSWAEFVDAAPRRAPVHVVDPANAMAIRGMIGEGLERIGRFVNPKTLALDEMVHGHGFRWDGLATALLVLARRLNVRSVRALTGHEGAIVRLHDDLA